MPVDDWVRAFTETKWQAHVFSKPPFREIVHEAAKTVLEDQIQRVLQVPMQDVLT